MPIWRPACYRSLYTSSKPNITTHITRFSALVIRSLEFLAYDSNRYRRSEFGIRAAIFFSAAAVSGSFGGLLAAAIGKMNGIGGKHGWAWIFILEGLATVLVGISSFWIVQDFPDDAKFLSEPDRVRVIRRLKADQQSSAEHEEFKMSYFWASVKDWKTLLSAVIYMGADCKSPFILSQKKNLRGSPSANSIPSDIKALSTLSPSSSLP